MRNAFMRIFQITTAGSHIVKPQPRVAAKAPGQGVTKISNTKYSVHFDV